MKSQHLVNKSSLPGFKTLLWDNIKTTAMYGAFAGGSIPYCVGYAGSVLVAAGCVCCTCIPPALDEKSCKETINAFDKIGLAVGAITALPIGLASSLLCSIPFAISAQYTRKFKDNTEIVPLTTLANQYEKWEQKLIIQNILKANKKTPIGIRSYESYQLISTLKNSRTPINLKWQQLTSYLNEKSSTGAYVNNGKKLFNTILDVIDKNKKELSPEKIVQDEMMDEIQNLINYYKNNSYPINHPLSLRSRCFEQMSLLDYAIKHNKINVVTRLLQFYQEDGFEMNDFHPIHVAIFYNRPILAELLINFYPDFNLYAPISNGLTPLMFAAKYGYTNTVKVLLNKKIDINQANTDIHDRDYNHTALQIAEKYGHNGIVNLLTHYQSGDNENDRIKFELNKIQIILKSLLWNKAGGFLFNHTPGKIKSLRNCFSKLDSKKLSSLSDTQIKTLVTNLKGVIGTHSDATTSQHQLYTLILNIGSNYDNDYAELEKKYIIDPPTSASQVRRKF